MMKTNILRYELRKFVSSKRMLALLMAILCLFGYNMYQANQKTLEYDHQLLVELKPYRTAMRILGDTSVAAVNSQRRVLIDAGVPENEWLNDEFYAESYAEWKKFDDAYFVLEDEFQMLFVPVMYDQKPQRYEEKERWVKTKIESTQTKLKLFEEGYVGTIDRLQTQLKAQEAFYTYLDEHQMSEYNSPNVINGTNFLVNMFDGYTLFIIFCFFALWMVYADTAENDNETYKLLMSAPLSRTRLVLTRFVFHVLVMLVMLCICVLLGFAVSSAIGGVGSFAYPKIINTTDVVPVSTYLLYALGTTGLAIVAWCALLGCISTIFSYFENAMIVGGFVLVVVIFMRLLHVTSPVMFYFLPYLYVFPDIFTQGINEFHLLLGVVAALGQVIVLLLVHIKLMKQKDFGDFSVFRKWGMRV
ncbi:hypothetical protein A4S06_00230 [Erysipelotrichaceae bacterium MTC7]|nr:hypothetical protein A4S06_00230 [Erysipelotrichaceae bacterium MTC7]